LVAEVVRIEIRKSERRAVAFDAEGRMVANYPVAIGSAVTPSPAGVVEVVAIAMDPTYSYLPDTNFVVDGVTESLILPPGPNGPVGSVWIDLSKPTYGLHGTNTPAALFQAESRGCVRFTNWDVEELAHLVKPGTTVEFLE
jgi:lipoprotein-anchoring transpeptidase ErfK/SrfK